MARIGRSCVSGGAIGLLALVTVLAGCAEIASLSELRNGLIAEFAADVVSVHRSGTELTVYLANPRDAGSEESARSAFALSVAEFVREHYVGYQDIDLVVVNVSRQLDAASTETRAYRFERAQLGEPRSLETSASAQ